MASLAPAEKAPAGKPLKVGSPHDPAEREADRIADLLTAPEEPAMPVCAACAAGGAPCAACGGGDGGGVLRRQVAGGGDGGSGGEMVAPPSVHRVLSEPGEPLPAGIRGKFERRLGVDLGAVIVHTEGSAFSSGHEIQARAFAAGNDIGFAKGEFSPHTNAGRHLLAHEISHVVLGHGGVRRMYDNWDSNGDSAADAWSPREHIDAALRGDGSHHINALYDFSSATTPEKLKLIAIVLKLRWVGPSDESALERIWESFDDQLVAVATSKAETTKLWMDSIDVGAELGNLPPVLAFARKVEERAVPVAKSLLKQSETSLNSERIRYGLNRVSRQRSDCLAGSCVDNIDTMASGVDSAGLAAAAKRLAVALREIKGLESRRNQALQESCDREGNCFERDPRLAAEMEAELRYKYPSYNEARNEAEKQFPILIPYTQTADLSALESIATGSGDKTAETLNDVLFEKLANVTKVRNELEEDPALVWKLTPVLEATLVDLGYSKESIQSGFIKARVDAIERDKSLIEMGLGLIALGLGLLAAIPTGGLSLVATAGVVAAGAGAAGISGYLAYEHLQEYQFLHAAAGSDFDNPRAISSEDPSLFWLALDIVGAVLDFAAAKSALKAFATSARELRAAKDAAEVAKASQAVRDAAAAAGQSKELAEKIISTAERARGAETVEQNLKREVDAAVQSATKELNAAEDVGRAVPAVEAGGVHEVKTLRGGKFAVCSDPCHLVRGFFARELAENPEFEKRLVDLERRSAEAQVPIVNKIDLDKVRAEAATLTGDMRNAREVRELTAVSAEQVARIAAMDREMVARLAKLEPAMAKHMLALAPDQLSKLGALSAEEFGRVAKLGEGAVTKLAQLEPPALAKFVKLEPEKLAYVTSLSADAVDWLATLPPKALDKIAAAEIGSPFSLRKMAEKINAKTSMKDIDNAIKRAKRHEAQVAAAFEAEKTGDWSKIPDKASVGRHLGYEIEEIVRAFGASGFADKVMHYSQLTKKAVADLQKVGGRVLITQGQLKGGKLRFDIALIDFDKKSFELIDLVTMAHSAHAEKTRQYMDELQKLLGKEFKPSSKELRYVDAEGKVVDTLEESVVTK